MVEKIESRMKAYFFNQSNPISFTRFLAIFSLACNTNNFREKQRVWFSPSSSRKP